VPPPSISTTDPAPAAVAAPPATASRRPFAAGARAITPLVLGAAPFGVAIGASSAGLGIDRLSTWIASWSMVAGTSQLTAMQLLHEGAAPQVALLAALIVNARFAVYSAGLAPWFRTTTARRRLLLAFPLVDQVYMTATTTFTRTTLSEADRRSFYLGAAAHFVAAWVAAQTVGILAGSHLPDWLDLHTASVIALVGLLATATATRPAVAAAVVAAVVALIGAQLPAHSAVLVATLAGIAAARTRRAP
jgi:predicted branched-subunit amino acid permease